MLAISGKNRIGSFAGPESEAVVVLGGKDDVFGSGRAEDFRPGVGIPLFNFGVKGRGEIVVVVIRTIGLAMIFLRGRPINTHRVVIPLGIRIVGDVILRSEIVIGMDKRSPAGDRVETPVNEDAEFCVGVPGGEGMLIE